MEYSEGDQSDHNLHSEDVPYPDIDESFQYPWQGHQSAATTADIHSVLDPRLYKDLFAGSAPQGPDHNQFANEADDDRYQGVDSGDDSYEVSVDESSGSVFQGVDAFST